MAGRTCSQVITFGGFAWNIENELIVNMKIWISADLSLQADMSNCIHQFGLVFWGDSTGVSLH